MQPLTLLSVISSNRLSGPGVPALAHAKLLQEAGHRVLFACRPDGPLAEAARHRGLELFLDLDFPRRGEVWKLPHDARLLRRLGDQEGLDLILTHQTIETIAAGLGVGGKRPVVRVWHDGSGRPIMRAMRWWMEQHGIRLAATTPTAARAAASGEDAKPVPVLPAPVNVDRYHPRLDGSLVRTEQGIGPGEVVAALVARWKPGRGLERFLDLFARAAHTEERLRALLLGRGKLQEALAAQAENLGIAERVTFLSPGCRFPESVAAADLGVLMETGSDGSARPGLELMAAGKPMLVADHGSLPDLAASDPAGAIVCATDDEMVGHLVDLARSLPRRRRLGAAARDYVCQRHAPRRVRATLERFVADVLADSPAAQET